MDEICSEEIREFDQMTLRDDHVEKPVMIRWRSGKEVDDKLMTVLHAFRELYIGRGEFFKKIFPELLHDAFADAFEKIDAVVKKDQMKMKTLQGSLSIGSPRELKKNDDSELRLQRFKVRIPDLSGVPSGSKGGGAKLSR